MGALPRLHGLGLLRMVAAQDAPFDNKNEISFTRYG